FVASTVRTVDHDLETIEHYRSGHTGFQENQVAAVRVINPRRLAKFAGYRAMLGQRAIIENQVLDARFRFIVEFEPIAGEELYPVVLERIVGSRNYAPGLRAHAPGKKGDPGSGQRPHQPDIDPHRADAGFQRGFEHVPRQSSVLADENLAPSTR